MFKPPELDADNGGGVWNTILAASAGDTPARRVATKRGHARIAGMLREAGATA
jgi:hypothetical protein